MNHSPKIIDLFAGVGGLSLGAARAGFQVSAAVELDPIALSTHSFNFPQSVHLDSDVSKLSGNELLLKSGLRKGELDGLVGGPPCQGFSFMGKMNKDDLRNDLFVHFFRLVSETKPKFFVAENVPGILNERYDQVRQTAFDWIKEDYKILNPIRVKADIYGAPTSRTRIFFIGYNVNTFRNDLEVGFFTPVDRETIVVNQALEGLPIYTNPNWQDEKSSWQKVKHITTTKYHRSLFDHIPEGVGDLNVIERVIKGEVPGFLGTIHTPEIIRRYSELQPGQQDPISRATKLKPDGFCPTLRAGTTKEKGSYQAVRPIHYLEPRVINPREAARLQGFPDWFLFHPTKWHSFRQIGNSVSPIVAEAIMGAILSRI